jgi:hypothetical protein
MSTVLTERGALQAAFNLWDDIAKHGYKRKNKSEYYETAKTYKRQAAVRRKPAREAAFPARAACADAARPRPDTAKNGAGR